MEDAALWGEISNMSKKNTQDLEIKTENYRNTKMPKYKIQKPQSENAASGGEVSNISQEHNLSVALYKKRSCRTGNMFFTKFEFLKLFCCTQFAYNG